MDFFTRCWKRPELLAVLAAALLLASCSEPDSRAGPSIRVLGLQPAAQDVASGDTLSLHHELSAEVLDALTHGVPITFQWQLQRRMPRALLWDSLLWGQIGERQISYRSLSRRFTLSQPTSGEATSFRDLPTLLAALDQIAIGPLPTPEDDPNSYLQVRARLVISRLPPALRLSSYLSDQWRMDSGWVRLSVVGP